jgi:hypothetical protein
MLTFYSLEGYRLKNFTVPKYKWIKVLDKVLIIYLDNDDQ